ncbi:response regulator [Promicromonospora thailandica]|uniref:DNA-binding response regulator, OmpR family, contains REC and winged-helix (WHTH) domain n=1 Tax=Promicromonospora thailandica TaxID=765201 RepID=A0A9X2G0D3_9MICO|nr:response regulator transcription factor [Promicromonospora thailandica]MCP2264730.1 DNA-binding response regulator, OmpR family, contains REC and winged-helix (wHTH) domain [Promicromonospora thailandica]BFF19030.1 response regulator transcription factor [Promicromonospora thailandica]
MSRILLIEDDHAVRVGLGTALGRYGHDVAAAASGEEGLRLHREHAAELVLLDLMLPGMDGFEVCRRIRGAGTVPIVMLTARGDDVDVVSGLEAGADDYVVKPVEPRVVDARIRAVLRRAAPAASAAAGRTTAWGDLVLDRAAMTVTRAGRPVAMTPTELRLLLELSASPGQVLSRQQLLESVWEHSYLGDSRLVDNGVQRLRAKIEPDPARPVLIQTVRGFGYRFGPV